MRITNHISMVGSGQIGLSSACDCHVYALCVHEGVVLIDAGSGLGEEAILAEISRDFPGSAVRALLLTHAHADHATGAQKLCERFGCELICGELTAQIVGAADEQSNGLAHARQMGAYPAELHMEPVQASRRLRSGEFFEVAGIDFEALQIRGHSNDSFCYIATIGGEHALFSGDVLFYAGTLGVINTPDSGMQGYCADLPQLLNRKIELLLPSHGLFTLRDGQRHIDAAVESCTKGFLPRQIGQGDVIF